MSSPSNLYAEKIYSEHPTLLWALDDQCDYISLISEDQRKVYNWTPTDGILSNSSATDEPFPTSSVTKVVGNKTKTGTKIVSPDLFRFKTLDSNFGTFALSGYIYSKSQYIAGIDIGYEYYDATSGSLVTKTRQFITSIPNKWLHVAETFSIPTDDVYCRIVISINYIPGGTDEDYEFLINGVTAGQWSEEFNATSLGQTKISLPTSINLPASNAIPAYAYGLEDKQGYYLVNENKLLAKNSGAPMVFGSSNITTLQQPESGPSVIVPGNGFLNDFGKFKEQTLEFWMRVHSYTSIPKRIVGPISSDDGLWVNGPFLILKIGNQTQSYSVGEWYRPMLIHIRYSRSSVSMFINGDEVISLNISLQNLSFPTKTTNSKDNDWIGFYTYDDVSPFEVDCVAIYSYKIPAIVAKRRFVYGQGVEYPEQINAAYGGKSAVIDYPFSKYSNNYNYPDIGNWSQGYLSNLSIVNNSLQFPKYDLPEIRLSNKTEAEFYSKMHESQNEIGTHFLTFQPEGWSSTQGYLYFPKFEMLTTQVKSFYGIFKTKKNITQTGGQILFKVVDSTNQNFFCIRLDNGALIYSIKIGNTEEILYSTYFRVGEIFGVGINIDRFISQFGLATASFFGNRSSLEVYVGGDSSNLNTFSGNIYSISFANDKQSLSVDEAFNSWGVPLDYENFFTEFSLETGLGEFDFDAGTYSRLVWEHIADGGTPNSFTTETLRGNPSSYSIFPRTYFDKYYLDISSVGYWEDSIPLSYLAKYVQDESGDSYYDLDFIQLNVNYPAPAKYVESETLSQWNYGEAKTVVVDGVTKTLKSLKQEYSEPVQKSYSFLQNHLFTGYESYTDLKNKSIKTYAYDTYDSFIKTYVTFKFNSELTKTYGDYTDLTMAPKNGVISPGDEWITTKYEFVDGMVVYPPPSVNFSDLSITIHVEFFTDGQSRSPVVLKQLQLASQAFNNTMPNPIGTKLGMDIYPYKVSGLYYDNKSQNPFSIYKGSTPYFYLTRNSGIKVLGDFEPFVERGISIPINNHKNSKFDLMAAQFAFRYDQDFFPYSPTEIFNFSNNSKKIRFYVVATDPNGKRGKIYAISSKTGQIENGLSFYLNGKVVKDLVITAQEWNYFGLSFVDLLNMDTISGELNFNGPGTFNNVSLYEASRLTEVRDVQKRPWFRVKVTNDPTSFYDWDFWDFYNYLWDGVLVTATRSTYGANPEEIYSAYIGTNKFIVDDILPFSIGNYEYSVNSDIRWQGVIPTTA